MRYGFVGLGNLGGHLANSLVRGGFDVVLHDKDPKLRDLHLGATWADSIAELASSCTAVITCLPLPSISEAVLSEAIRSLAPGSTWIEMSTLGHDEIVRLARLAEYAGIAVLEAPVTGGVHLAAQGKITVLVGGDPDLLERHRPTLQAMGSEIFHMGPVGSAARIKVITNMLAFIHLIATGEALMLAKQSGLDLRQAWEAIKASSGTSFVHETEGQLILNGSYDVGFTMNLALKDLGFAMVMGEQLAVPLELAGLSQAIFERGREAYGGNAQSTQIVKLLEERVGTYLRANGFPARLG